MFEAALVLAVWRVSYMLAWEAGPFDIFETVRFAWRDNVVGRLLSCVYCVSVWVAAGLLLIAQHEPGRVFVYIMALSALSLVMHHVMEKLRR